MKKLDKNSYNHIKTMIKENDNIEWIKAFANGFGIDTNNYSSAVHISYNEITIKYRRKNEYKFYTNSKMYGTKFY